MTLVSGKDRHIVSFQAILSLNCKKRITWKPSNIYNMYKNLFLFWFLKNEYFFIFFTFFSLYRAYKFKGTESLNSNETEIVNIFHENPSSQKPTAQSNLEAILEEMDRFFHMPEGLDPKIWMKFCQIRRAKFLKEQQVNF